MAKSTFVIAIAGHSGAGKSTIIEKLAAKLDNAIVLKLDDYTSSSHYPPMKTWIENGANPNEYLTPKFAADIQTLKQGESIIHPESMQEISPAGFLIIEEPFGREREVMNRLIDFVVYIDVSLEIAHARKILRKNEFLPWEDDPDLFIKNLRDHLSWYLKSGREFFLTVGNLARKDCDLVIDGTLIPDVIVDHIIVAVAERKDE